MVDLKQLLQRRRAAAGRQLLGLQLLLPFGARSGPCSMECRSRQEILDRDGSADAPAVLDLGDDVPRFEAVAMG
ncbi:hypothetical protein OIU91_04775 [Streptomyces sp. NBC_01456]|uniref:hypothetical protein n=1 Tax=unclassified Streptomyces TaxID=2593676 RepID=UPI002E316325|nr:MULTISPECIES: hypothetical protein [unclassified Streptomyces]